MISYDSIRTILDGGRDLAIRSFGKVKGIYDELNTRAKIGILLSVPVAFLAYGCARAPPTPPISQNYVKLYFNRGENRVTVSDVLNCLKNSDARGLLNAAVSRKNSWEERWGQKANPEQTYVEFFDTSGIKANNVYAVVINGNKTDGSDELPESIVDDIFSCAFDPQ